MPEFTITVDRREPASKLGLSLEMPTMRVDEVGDGLVRLWNQENPSKQVKVGNVITKVNGSTEDMRGALAKAEILEVTFQTDEEIQEVPADPPVPKKKPKAWYTDTDTYFPVLVILGIVISFVTSFLLHR
mmetsp:Transcript_71216/g.212409  ORF Transcript_71216/g.212409 Transcript_71216/m.212409 type:complete len:130 (-) Transcript_71216:80-469(-)